MFVYCPKALRSIVKKQGLKQTFGIKVDLSQGGIYQPGLSLREPPNSSFLLKKIKEKSE